MAEKVVIAEFEVDADGVVQGVGETKRALAEGEGALVRLEQTSDRSAGTIAEVAKAVGKVAAATVLVTRGQGILSLAFGATARGAMALARGIGFVKLGLFAAGITAAVAAAGLLIAGIVAIVAILPTLAFQIIANSEAFQRLKAAVADWHAWLVRGERTLARLNRNMAEFSRRTILGEVQALRELVKQRAEAARQLEQLTASGGQEVTRPGLGTLAGAGVAASLLGLLPGGAAGIAREASTETVRASMEALRQGIAQTSAEIDEMIRRFVALGFTLEDIRTETGATLTGVLDPAQAISAAISNILALTEADRQIIARQEAMNRQAAGFFQGGALPPVLTEAGGIFQPDQFAVEVERLNQALMALQRNQAEIAGVQIDQALQNIAKGFVRIGFSAEEAAERIRSFGFEFEEVTLDPWIEFIERLAAGADKSVLKVQALQSAMAVLGDTVAKVGQGGGITFRGFAADVLNATAQMLFAFGAALIAKGFLTDNPVYIQQGIIAGAAGVAAAAAAGALSRQGGGPGGGGSRRSVGGGGTGSGVSRSVTVVVQGSLMGTDRNELARELKRLIATAEQDGAR